MFSKHATEGSEAADSFADLCSVYLILSSPVEIPSCSMKLIDDEFAQQLEKEKKKVKNINFQAFLHVDLLVKHC